MAKTTKILRKSIFTFLRNYQYFTSTPSFLAFPFAVSILLSQFFISSSYPFQFIHNLLGSIFLAGGLAPVWELFEIINFKFSQTILTFVFALPFTLSFLIISKASIIRALDCEKFDWNCNWIEIFNPLFSTQLCNSLVIISANATCFFLIVIAFNCTDFLGFSSLGTLMLISATGALIYSIVIANAYVICNLALILSGIEKRGGFISILKACVLIRGKTVTALSLSVSMNLGLVMIESLFQYRIVRVFNQGLDFNSYMVLEGLFIAYLYAVVLVLDTIVGSVFLKSCRTKHRIEMEDMCCHSIVVEEIFANGKLLELLF